MPTPSKIKVVDYLEPDEYVLYEQAMRSVRNRLGKRVSRAKVLVELCRRELAGAPARSKVRTSVVIHVDSASGQAWYETDRGPLPATPEQRDTAMAQGKVYLQGTLDIEPEKRTPLEQSSPGKISPKIPLATLEALFVRAGGKCEVEGCSSTTMLQAHHRQPRCEGGTHELDWLEVRCIGCHSLGHAKDYREKPQWQAAREARRRKRRAKKSGSG